VYQLLQAVWGLKHAARWPHVARQMHLCGPRITQKITRVENLINLAYFKDYYGKLVPAKAFSNKLRPATGPFSLECGSPMNLSLTSTN
jgi:hypothetical protein